MSDEFGGLPVNPEDLPLENVPMEESAVYKCKLVEFKIGARLSKAGVAFGQVRFEVIDGDFEGYQIALNYMPLPVSVNEDMPKATKIKLINQNSMFAKFARAFGIKGPLPAFNFQDLDTHKAYVEHIAQFYGNDGQLTIQNQEFPEGSGRLRPGVRDFVY